MNEFRNKKEKNDSTGSILYFKLTLMSLIAYCVTDIILILISHSTTILFLAFPTTTTTTKCTFSVCLVVNNNKARSRRQLEATNKQTNKKVPHFWLSPFICTLQNINTTYIYFIWCVYDLFGCCFYVVVHILIICSWYNMNTLNLLCCCCCSFVGLSSLLSFPPLYTDLYHLLLFIIIYLRFHS